MRLWRRTYEFYRARSLVLVSPLLYKNIKVINRIVALHQKGVKEKVNQILSPRQLDELYPVLVVFEI